jgi:excisionase family DNA binding protein
MASTARAATYTVNDIANRLGVCEETVLHWIRSGQLAAFNVGRSATAKKPRWRITPQALSDFERGRAAPKPAPTTRRRSYADGIIRRYT